MFRPEGTEAVCTECNWAQGYPEQGKGCVKCGSREHIEWLEDYREKRDAQAAKAANTAKLGERIDPWGDPR